MSTYGYTTVDRVRKRAHNPSTQFVTDEDIEAVIALYEQRLHQKLQKGTTAFSAAADGAEYFATVQLAVQEGAASNIMARFDEMTEDARLARTMYNEIVAELQNADAKTPIVKKQFSVNDGLDPDLYDNVGLI